MIVDGQHAPSTGGMGGSIHAFERGLDPWHRDAFPIEFQAAFVGSAGPRAEGWYALDFCGNVIGFIKDGTEIADPPIPLPLERGVAKGA